MPRPAGFVAKRELLAQPIARSYLRAIGAEFVERFAAQQGVQDAARMQALVKSGRALMFFPEGTFTQVAGLRPFRLGAFVVAANAGVPVVPIAISGTRRLLPGEGWWPRRAAIRLVIGAPIAPAADAPDAFAAALALRDAARAHILAHCGEVDLSQRGD
jgi:1-acyl-sn-glycerol-3-phosphate acyltransferase